MARIDRIEEPDRAVAAIDPVVLAELIKLATTLRSKTPDEVATPQVLQTRKDFLRESLGQREEADNVFERIIGGDELQPVNYLERGSIAARAVARVNLGAGSFGTGFMISPQVLITNNHVLPDATTAAESFAEFRYEVDLADRELAPLAFRFLPNELFHTDVKLDFSVVAVEAVSQGRGLSLSPFGYLPLVETTGKVSEGEWLTVIQHPQGKLKQICVRENQFIKRDGDVLWYTTDTEPGSSGSPVFNNDWFVVALHHAGVPDKKDGVTQKNPDGSTKWIGNEGIRVSWIVETLKQAKPEHPLLLPLYAATPASARIVAPPSTSPAATVPFPKEATMAENRTLSVPVELRLQMNADGGVEAIGVASAGRTESTASVDIVDMEKSQPTASFDAPFDDDYSKRKGYDPAFLGNKVAQKVELPELGDALEAVAAPILKPKNGNKFVLHYHNYSVVMHASAGSRSTVRRTSPSASASR